MEMENLQDVHASLLAVRRGAPIEETLARILSSWLQGYGVLPDWLGLGESRFLQMMCCHFPGYDVVRFCVPTRTPDIRRDEEIEDLRRLLVSHRSARSESEIWMAEIVAHGCLGDDHLWQDLGLWNRTDLSRLMLENFESLARRNDRDMKWKKFLYKQLCETEGVYTCRAPSCEVCADYLDCFGPEE